MAKQLLFPGEVEVRNITLTNYVGTPVDIRRIVLLTEFYEDIFTNTMSGFCVIDDNTGLYHRLPIMGQETIEFEFKTPEIESIIKKKFYVYKVENRAEQKKRKQSYTLHFVSLEATESSNKKISEVFAGNITDTVTEIFFRSDLLNSKSAIQLEETSNNYKFTSAYWTPLEIINWLARRAFKGPAANFVFYEDNQKYNFTSIDKLLQQEPTARYIKGDGNSDTILGSTGEVSQIRRLEVVRSYYPKEDHDYIKKVETGYFAARLTTFDTIFRNASPNDYDYYRDFKKNYRLEENPIGTEETYRNRDASIYNITKNGFRFQEYEDQNYDRHFLQNNTLIQQAKAMTAVLEVPGKTSVKAGDVIDFTLNRYDTFGTEEASEIKDKRLSGKYLITAIKHTIVADNHTMFLEIMKESVADPYKENLR